MTTRGYGYKLPPDIVRGLNQILVESLLPEGNDTPFTVITTAPSLWNEHFSSETVTVLDVSNAVGPTNWASDVDARNRLISEIRDSGWPDACIGTSYRVSTSGRRYAPDLVIFDEDQQPIAVVEVRAMGGTVGKFADQVRTYIEALKVPLGFLYTGSNLIQVDEAGRDLKELGSFPSPTDLGVPELPDAEFIARYEPILKGS